ARRPRRAPRTPRGPSLGRPRRRPLRAPRRPRRPRARHGRDRQARRAPVSASLIHSARFGLARGDRPRSRIRRAPEPGPSCGVARPRSGRGTELALPWLAPCPAGPGRRGGGRQLLTRRDLCRVVLLAVVVVRVLVEGRRACLRGVELPPPVPFRLGGRVRVSVVWRWRLRLFRRDAPGLSSHRVTRRWLDD